MSKRNPFGQNFNPYDALIELNERLSNLEQVHNQLAHDYLKTQQELTIALECLNTLQKGHLALSNTVTSGLMDKFDIDPSEIYGNKSSR